MDTLVQVDVARFYRAGYTPTHVLSLPVVGRDPQSSYKVLEIEGLGPSAASINTSAYSGRLGTMYNSSTLNERNIVLTIEYRTDQTAQPSVMEARENLYNALPPTGGVRLTFRYHSGRRVQIDGYVETHEPTIFTSRPTVTISLICPDPYFKEQFGKFKTGTTWTSLNLADVLGTGLTGFEVAIDTTATYGPVMISNDVDPEFYISSPVVSRSSFKYSSVRGSKGVWANGTLILDRVVRGDFSMTLGGGNTTLLVRTFGTGSDQVRVPFTVNVTTSFIGV